jgi:hypothetical protein
MTDTDIPSLCPMNASNLVAAEAIIPVSSTDVSGIPPIALQIPDFEGYATLRIFSNATQTQIGCYQAVMRNGATFSQPASVGSILALFTAVAVIASFVTAIYGISIPAIRTHYAHSLSVLVIFEVFHSIFFSGALSLNWPSVLAAWWSNFAWSAGMIYSSKVNQAINSFTGNNGNSSQVGSAGSTPLNTNGGLTAQIYGRSLNEMTKGAYDSVLRGTELAERIYKRAAANTATNASSDPGYSWNGGPVGAGLIVPGNWTGFGGELSEVNLPATNAFTTGLLWFAILLAALIVLTVLFKFTLEALSSIKRIEPDRLEMFRNHWTTYLGLIVLRTCFIAFFMLTTLSLYQLALHGKPGPMAIAAIVFLIFMIGFLGLCGYACFYRLRFGHYESSPDRLHFRRRRVLKVVPWFGATRTSSFPEEEKSNIRGNGLPFFSVRYIDNDAARATVHQDISYIRKFGWLSARYRRTRWWFFAVWAGYQLVRACFIGAAYNHPTVQVIGVLIVEIIALVAFVWINPYEGARNTALGVYMLGISKVATAGLSIAFLPQLYLDRILATVVGVIIIVIQGFLVIGMLILMALGVISSYFSIMRNREDVKPLRWEGLRVKYYRHLDARATDLPPAPKPVKKEPELPKEPYFAVGSVRRMTKIEDEMCDPEVDLVGDLNASNVSLPPGARTSRANSIRSHYTTPGLPYGARAHRVSWSSKDFAAMQQVQAERDSAMVSDPALSRGGSRHVSGNYNDAIMAPSAGPSRVGSLYRPSSVASLNGRCATPTKDYRSRYAGERNFSRPNSTAPVPAMGARTASGASGSEGEKTEKA